MECFLWKNIWTQGFLNTDLSCVFPLDYVMKEESVWNLLDRQTLTDPPESPIVPVVGRDLQSFDLWNGLCKAGVCVSCVSSEMPLRSPPLKENVIFPDVGTLCCNMSGLLQLLPVNSLCSGALNITQKRPFRYWEGESETKTDRGWGHRGNVWVGMIFLQMMGPLSFDRIWYRWTASEDKGVCKTVWSKPLSLRLSLWFVL